MSTVNYTRKKCHKLNYNKLFSKLSTIVILVLWGWFIASYIDILFNGLSATWNFFNLIPVYGKNLC